MASRISGSASLTPSVPGIRPIAGDADLDDVSLTAAVLSKFCAGTLPALRPSAVRAHKTWAGQGKSETCDACDQPIAPRAMLYEVKITSLGVCRFHEWCFDTWIRERRWYLKHSPPMDYRIRKLQVRVRVLHRGQAASQVRYPDDLRTEITAVTCAAKAAGRSIRSLAREIGVSAPTLIEWSRRPTRRSWRPVRLPVAPETIASVSPVLVITPHGFRVEGLDVAGVVTVLRGLA